EKPAWSREVARWFRRWHVLYPGFPCVAQGRTPCSVSTSRSSVGSRAGAVLRRQGLSVAHRFLWECLTSPAVNPSPDPSTSHGAGGFPALRSPVRFVPRVMRPIGLAALSAMVPDDERGTG